MYSFNNTSGNGFRVQGVYVPPSPSLAVSFDALTPAELSMLSALNITVRGSATATSGNSSTVSDVTVRFNITTTVKTLTANTSQQLVAQNLTRNYLAWMVVGQNPVTIVSGNGPAVVNQGMNYNGTGDNTNAGFEGGSENYPSTHVPTNAFQAISLLGSVVIVWEG